jgi:hypothetical protein
MLSPNLTTLRQIDAREYAEQSDLEVHWWRAVFCLSILAISSCLLQQTAAADDAQPAAVKTDRLDPAVEQFFEQKVRPLLVTKCMECHGSQKQKGGLRLDSRDAVVKGGDAGSVIASVNPATSLLLEVISYQGDLKMPPKSKLSEAEIADLTQWVKLGAPWPTEQAAPLHKAAGNAFTISAEQRAFWAFQPIANPAPPSVRQADWGQSPLDQFILADLESQGLQPAPAADKRTLIRRVTIDLTGVPPTPAEIAEFLADIRPDAFARLVDRLLDSPRYGERMARHWLDVARYADSNGLDENLAYANAFQYRDYVVRALNQDKPFHEFVREQIAGDLLPDSGVPQLQQDRLIATGFLCLGAKMLAEDDPVKMQMDIIDEQVDTIGRAFMGLTLGCARCHDHKFDPLSQADYYALGGIFKSTKTMENFSVVARWQERPLATPELIQARDAHQTRINTQKQSVQRNVTAGNLALSSVVKQQVGRYLLAATRQSQLAQLMDQAKPLGNSPDLKSLPGAILLEAEDYVRGNVLKDRETYGKEIGVLVNKGETPNYVEHEFQIPKQGLYQVELRYAAAASRPCSLRINGRLLKSDVAGKTTGSWTPETQSWFVEGVFPLTAGPAVLRLEQPVFFPHIDKILLVPVAQAEHPIVDEPSEGTPLHAGYVQQFVTALEQSKKDPQSIWTAWHQYMKDRQLVVDRAVPENDVSRLLADKQPDSLTELSKRYSVLFVAAGQGDQRPANNVEEKSVVPGTDLQLAAVRKILNDEKGVFAIPKDAEAGYPTEIQSALKVDREQLQALEAALPKFPETMAVSDQKPENLKIHIRGSHLSLGAEVPRQFPQILVGDSPASLPLDHSGRLDLANWLANPEHPLTSRVIVNRVWQWHFGAGLVRTPDNFGRLGERPTHPQLLDWLARRFTEQGWSLKALHRMLILSSTYQQSTHYNPAAAQLDPENRLWWRMNRQRMEVEVLRDSLLVVSGGLDDVMGGTQLTTPNRGYVTSTANVNPVVYQTNRRSIYLPVVRSALFELFQAFDFADPSVLNGHRDQTTVAPQALFMMNSSFVLEQSRRLARTLVSRSDLDDTSRIRLLYEMAYGRPPSEVEVQRGKIYMATFQQAARDKLKTEDLTLRAWESLCRAILAANEFLYVE